MQRILMLAALCAAMAGCAYEAASEPEPADFDPAQEAAAIERSRTDRAARAEDAVEDWLEAHPEDAPLREELVAWEREQLVVDDLSEGSFSAVRYGFGREQ